MRPSLLSLSLPCNLLGDERSLVPSPLGCLPPRQVRCPGLSSLVLNLGLPDLPDVTEVLRGGEVWNAGGREGDAGPWLAEYLEGASLEPYAFLLAHKYTGRTFGEVREAFHRCALAVMARARI